MKRNDCLYALFLFAAAYLFLLCLNAVFPTQSDDLGRGIGGIRAAIGVYKGWNGRFGELLLHAGGSWFSTTALYAPVNACAGACVVMLVFVHIFGRVPEKSLKDTACFSAVVLCLLCDRSFSFGSVFYWAAGSFNYLWGWLFILAWLAPLSLFWRNAAFTRRADALLLAAEIPLGVAAGWSSELGIVIVIASAASVAFARRQRRRLPAWYCAALVSFAVGWVILYSCPGMRVRATLISSYLSLSDFFRLGFGGMAARIAETFGRKPYASVYVGNFVCVSLFLLLTSAFHKPSRGKFESCSLAIFMLLFSLKSMPGIFFLCMAIFVCALCAKASGNENSRLSRSFWCMAGVLAAEFLFIAATVQIPIPRRAFFPFTALNICLAEMNLSLCFDALAEKSRARGTLCACCAGLAVVCMAFVGAECFAMRAKWNAMVASVEEQKARGVNDVVVPKSTFESRYKNYGDWGNPGGNVSVWPNTAYAQFFGVESFSVR